MKTPSEDRIDRLPQWARNYITWLEREVANRDAALEATGAVDFTEVDEGTPFVFLDTMSREVLPLPEGVRVSFPTGAKHTRLEVGLNHRGSEGFVPGELRVSATGTSIAVLPDASNTVRITMGRN